MSLELKRKVGYYGVLITTVLTFVGFRIQPAKLHGGLVLEQFGLTGVTVYCVALSALAISRAFVSDIHKLLFYAYLPLILHMLAVISFQVFDSIESVIRGEPNLPSTLILVYSMLIYGIYNVRS